jgi:NADH-quinone oxidoreductase subunit D
MDLLALLTGNRVNYGLNCIGGVRRDISPQQAKAVGIAVDKLEERTRYYLKIAGQETTLIKRLSGVGVLSREDALRLGAVGPTLRASGIERDTRRDDPYAAYAELDFKVITDTHCDVYGRTIVRVKELMESYKMVRQLLEKMPAGPLAVRAPRSIPAGEATSRYEAPRGEDVHYVKANGTDKPERVKVRAPTLANIQAVKHMLRERFLADMPIVIAAIDPCFSCTDRSVILRNGRAKKQLSWPQLRAYGIAWHRSRGIDFTKLNSQLSELTTYNL